MGSTICPCSPIWEFVWLAMNLNKYLLYNCQGDDARQAMASHSLNNVLTAARPASCMLCNSSSPSSQIDLASFNSCTAYCHVTGVIWGRHRACYQFGLSTLKQMKCPHRNIYPNLTLKIQMLPYSVSRNPGSLLLCLLCFLRKTTSPSSTLALPGPTSPAQLGAETERLIAHVLMFSAISTMCTWIHMHVSVR